MPEFFLELGIAVSLFISTNIDDIFILLALFSDRRLGAGQVIAGQFLGIFALALGSMAVSLGAGRVPMAYVGLLGLVPFGMGVKKLWDLARSNDDDDDDSAEVGSHARGFAKILAVTGVTLANGGDNVGVYVPVFATKPAAVLGLYLLVFAVGTAAWCAGALYLVKHPRLGGGIEETAEYLVPWVFIGLGIYVLFEAGSFSLLG